MADPLMLETNASMIAKQFESLQKSLAANYSTTQKLQQGLSHLEGTMNSLKSVVGALGVSIAADLSFKTIIDSTNAYNKSLFDISQRAKVTGQTFGQMKTAIEGINKETNLSLNDSAKLVDLFQKNTIGVKLNSSELIKMSKALETAHASSEDMIEGSKQLLSLQQKDVDVLKKLNTIRSDKEARAYANELLFLRDATQDEVDEFLKLNLAMREGPKALDPSQKGLKNLSDSIRALQKAGQDLLVSVGTPMINMFVDLAGKLKTFIDLLNGMPDWAKKLAVGTGGAVAVGTSVLGAVSSISAISKLAGMVGTGAKAAGTATSLGGTLVGGGTAAAEVAGPATAAAGGLAALVAPAAALAAAFTAAAAIGYFWLDQHEAWQNAEKEIKSTTDAIAKAREKFADAMTKGDTGKEDRVDSIKKQMGDILAKGGKAEGSIWTVAGLESIVGKQSVHERGNLSKEDQAKFDALGKELEDANQDLAKNLQATFDKAQKDAAKTGGVGKGSAAQVDKILGTPEGGGAEGPAATQQALSAQIKNLETIKKINDDIINSQKVQGDYAVKFNNDIAGAQAMNEQIASTLRGEIGERKKALDLVDKMLADGQDLETNTKIRAKLTTEMTTRETELRNVELAKVDILEEQKSLKDAQLSLAESELNLSQQLYMGLGPTIEAQMKIVDIQEQQIANIEQQIADTQKILSSQPGNVEAQKKLLGLQQQKNAAVSKELEVTKNLREGYLDAMGAFTNVEGAFSKVILKRESGMGEIVRQFGAQGGAKTGAGGAGSNDALARWKAGGQFEFAGSDQMNKTAEGYNIFSPISRGHVGAAQAQKASGTTDYFAAGGTNVQTAGGGGGLTPDAIAQRMANATIGGGGNVAPGTGVGAPAGSVQHVWVDNIPNGAFGATVTPGTASAGNQNTDAGQKAAAAQAAVQAAAQMAAEAKKNPALAFGATGKAGDYADIARGKGKPMTTADYQKGLTDIASTIKDLESNPEANAAKLAEAKGIQNQLKGAMRESQKEDVLKGKEKKIQDYLDNNRAGGRGLTKLSETHADVASKMADLAKNPERAAKAKAVSEQASANRQKKMLADALEESGGKEDGRTKHLRAMADKAQNDADKAKKAAGMSNDDVTRAMQGLTKATETSSKTVGDNTKAQQQGNKKMSAEQSVVNSVAKGSIKLGGDMGLDELTGMTPEQISNAITGTGGGGGSSGSDGGGAEASMATGGFTPGTGNKDSIPALLMPGEFVMNKETSRKYGWLLNSLNQNKFADGGLVGGLSGPVAPAAGAGGGFNPAFHFNIKGDSVNKMTRMAMTQLSSQLNKMMTPSGSSGRFFDSTQ